MKINQTTWTAEHGWQPAPPKREKPDPQLVFLFGGRQVLKDQTEWKTIQSAFPNADLIGCSTSGEINGLNVYDDSLVLTAIHFEHSQVKTAQVHLSEVNHDSFSAGAALGKALNPKDLVHVIVISDGNEVNGSALVRGLTDNLPTNVAITGGLAGDGDRFEETLVLLNDKPEPEKIAVVGLYGKHIKIGYGSMGGWDPFGPDRLITRSEGNILYELDSQPALTLYKRYLGAYAEELPASALLFPLSLRDESRKNEIVRTILSIDEENNAMIFAGDVPQGMYARLMKANFERLVDGASQAASVTYESIGSREPELALLISCVGRKLVLKQRVEDEIESIQEVLGEGTALTGFYSYGEICPNTPNTTCELHNQTMTITTLSERA